MVWPASKHQEKCRLSFVVRPALSSRAAEHCCLKIDSVPLHADAARVYRAFAAVIMSDSKLREQLIEDMGFTIKAIRMSPDHAKAFILWDVYKVTPSVAKHVIQKLTPRLKGGISKAMAAKNVPRLEFKHDKMSVEEEELGRIFQEIEKENK